MSKCIEDSIYPLTITADRYSGTYSGGKYIAWNLCADDVPEGAEADDISCYNFWSDNEIVYGKGETAMEALFDLYAKLKGDEEEWLQRLRPTHMKSGWKREKRVLVVVMWVLFSV